MDNLKQQEKNILRILLIRQELMSGDIAVFMNLFGRQAALPYLKHLCEIGLLELIGPTNHPRYRIKPNRMEDVEHAIPLDEFEQRFAHQEQEAFQAYENALKVVEEYEHSHSGARLRRTGIRLRR